MGMTIALLFSLGTCIVRIQNNWLNFACTKRFFNLLAEAIINVRNVGLCARCPIFFLMIKHSPFSSRLVKGFTVLKRAQNQFKMLLEISIVLASIVPKREMRISWWLCNNFEIHLCLWGVWSLVVCSQSSFYVTRARKDDKNRKHVFSSLKKTNLVPNKQLLLNVPFQSTK